MTGDLTVHDAITAGIAVVAGLLAAGLLRVILRWLGERALRTRWIGDDIIVDILRTLAPCAAVAAGVAVGAAALPLNHQVRHTVNQTLVAVVMLSATFTAARVISGLIRTVTQSRSGVAGQATIFVNITRITVLAMGFLVILETLGISIAPLLTALGVGGLAIALAMRDTLANLFAGVHILVSKTVQPGDYIRLSSGEEGYVVDINWRNTVVEQLSNNLVIIPNAQLAGTNMTNFSRPEQPLTVTVQVGVGYDSDLEHVEKVTNEVVASVMRDVDGAVPDHEPAVRFHTFGDSRIGFTVILGVGEYSDKYRIKHEFIKRLHQRYRAEGIRIPAPARTVSLQGGEADPLIPHPRTPAEGAGGRRAPRP
ncbi:MULTISPECIES: mechanosensitive ion channel family protein [Streptomyces]|uniref:mechanosensitive ion channel family protein n=1 Tax=Streptomyces TaxID=1883 RepID=UPI00163CEFD0|nr:MULTISPECIES: mechanosensitive ion channel family protein [Streptomyces]MBC2878677.1 mechanosensitive ion channel family protein [Streptomyces sp. TYQ1024]UBI35121.1 mechanosensitive ion channel family protein [Streptomyces mobaraensis]UKW27715.1 mechanosensitive ion channel family protein [Streptomyces sp. TYQ1024]